jgi:hypothetical protein
MGDLPTTPLPFDFQNLSIREQLNLKDSLMFEVLEEGQNTLNRQNIGFVYILGSSTGYFKIGRTSNLVKRLKTFEVKLPFEVWLELSFAFYDCVWAEKYWHAHFSMKRLNGEWFKLEHKDLLYFQNYSDEWMDFKLTKLLELEPLCSWDADFKRNLAGYELTPSERTEIVSAYSWGMKEQLKNQTKYRDEFFFRGIKDYFEQVNFNNALAPDNSEVIDPGPEQAGPGRTE